MTPLHRADAFAYEAFRAELAPLPEPGREERQRILRHVLRRRDHRAGGGFHVSASFCRRAAGSNRKKAASSAYNAP